MSISSLATLSERLHDRVAEVAGELNRAHAQLVGLVAELIASEAWADGAGIVSPAHWLMLRAGLSRARAHQVVALAERSAELPATMKAFAAGDISIEQAAPIGKYVPTEFEASVLELARHATVPQITRAAAGTDFSPTPGYEENHAHATTAEEAAQRNDAHGATEPVAPPSLSMSHSDGRFHLHYNAPSDIGALVEHAIREAADAAWRQRNGLTLDDSTHPDGGLQTGDGAHEAAHVLAAHAFHAHALHADADAGSGAGGGPESRGGRAADRAEQSFGANRAPVTLADGLAEVANRSMSAVGSASRRDRYRIYVHLDTRGGWLTGRPRLPQHLNDALTCDGILQPVWFTDGAPVNVGRAQRVVPERTRRLLDDRDRGCRFPGCLAVGYTEKHHVIHWHTGGLTDTDNLISLCSAHHDAHHRGDYLIRGNPDLPEAHPAGIRFTTPQGYQISYRPPPASGRPPPPGAPYSGPTGAPMHARNVVFFPTPARPSE